MKFTIMRLNTPNRNNRVYPTETFQLAIDEYNKQIVEKRAIGVIGEYETDKDWSGVNLEKASHIVEKLEIVGDEVHADIKVLDTLAGQKLRDLLATTDMTFRPRGEGQIHNTADVYVVSEYKLVSIDAIPTDKAA